MSSDKKKTLEDVGGHVFLEQNGEETSIRETELYRLALANLQWQRDNYLVGKDYAEQRKTQRNWEQDVPVEETALSRGLFPYNIPVDATALGNVQLGALGSWFIPSKTVHYSLLPIVLDMPLGSSFVPILKATANLIPLFQGNLDLVLKRQILSILNNQHWRNLIKTSTKGYIANTYVDASRRSQR